MLNVSAKLKDNIGNIHYFLYQKTTGLKWNEQYIPTQYYYDEKCV